MFFLHVLWITLKYEKRKDKQEGFSLIFVIYCLESSLGIKLPRPPTGMWCFQKPVHLGPASQNPFLKGGEGSFESSAGVPGRSHHQVNKLRQDE